MEILAKESKIKRNQKQILEMKIIILELKKKSLHGLKGILERAEERIRKPEDKTMEVI